LLKPLNSNASWTSGRANEEEVIEWHRHFHENPELTAIMTLDLEEVAGEGNANIIKCNYRYARFQKFSNLFDKFIAHLRIIIL